MTGCGVGDRFGDNQEASGELDAWMDVACGAVDSVAKVANQRSQLDWAQVKDPKTADELVDHLGLVAAEIGTARRTLNSLGAPPVDDGEALLSELDEGVNAREKAAENAIDFIEGAVSRVDPVAPVQIARAAQAAYTAAPRIARYLERQRELRAAYEANPNCTDL